MIRPVLPLPLLVAVHATLCLAVLTLCSFSDEIQALVSSTGQIKLETLLLPLGLILIVSMIFLLIIRALGDSFSTLFSPWKAIQFGLLAICSVNLFLTSNSASLPPHSSLTYSLTLIALVHAFHHATEYGSSSTVACAVVAMMLSTKRLCQLAWWEPLPICGVILSGVVYFASLTYAAPPLQLSTYVASACILPFISMMLRLILGETTFLSSFFLNASPASVAILTSCAVTLCIFSVWVELTMGLFEVASSREEAMHIANMARQVASRLPPELVAKILKPSNGPAGTKEKGFEAYLTLADDVAREARTYDTNSSGFIDMLMDTQLTKAQEELLLNLQLSLAYSSRVLQNSILYFKADSGILVMDMTTTFEIQHMFDRALMENRYLEDNMNVNVIRRVEAGFPALIGDVTYLSVIIQNLIDNSAKFTIQGSVTLSARVLDRPRFGKDAGTALVEFGVIDTGCGIPAAQLPILKIPFSTKNEAFWSAQDTKGAGLGIPTADCLARAFPEGQLDIDTIEGSGTSVKFRCRLKIDPDVEIEQFGLERATDGKDRRIKLAVCAPEPTFATISGMLAPHGFELKHITSRMATADMWFDVKQASLQNEPYRCALIDALSQSAAPHHVQLVYSLASQLKSDPLTERIQTAILVHAGYFANEATKGENFNEAILKPLLYRQVLSMVKRMIGLADDSVFDLRVLSAVEASDPNAEYYDPYHLTSSASSSTGALGAYGGTTSQRSSTNSISVPSGLGALKKRRCSFGDLHAPFLRDSLQAIADGSISSGSSHSLLADLPESPTSSPRVDMGPESPTPEWPSSAAFIRRTRRSHTTDPSSIGAIHSFLGRDVMGSSTGTLNLSNVNNTSSNLTSSGGIQLGSPHSTGSTVGFAHPDFLKLSVLVVEDETLNRLVLKQMIKQLGHLPLTAENGHAGVAMYQKHHAVLDLVIMDYRMPHMDGVQATAAIRAYEEENNLPKVEIVALTADDSVRSKCIAAGMNDCWTKPVRIQVLQATLLQKVLQKDEALQALQRLRSSNPGTPTSGSGPIPPHHGSYSLGSTAGNSRHSLPTWLAYYQPQPNYSPHYEDARGQSFFLPGRQSPTVTTRETRTRSDPVLSSDEAASLASSTPSAALLNELVSANTTPTPTNHSPESSKNPLNLPPIPSKKPSKGSIGGEGSTPVDLTLDGLMNPASAPDAVPQIVTAVAASPALHGTLPSSNISSATSGAELTNTSSTGSSVPVGDAEKSGTAVSSSTPTPTRGPVSRGSRKALVPSSSASSATKRDSILLVEDNATVAKIATTVLERNHQKVEHVPDGQEAFEKISREHDSFDIVLMDIHLPKLSGFECTAFIRDFEKKHNLLPLYIIALTGDRHVDSEKYLSKGFNNFLRKPLNYPSLIAELPHIREQHASQRMSTPDLQEIKASSSASDIQRSS